MSHEGLRVVKPEPLTAEAFAPFGDLIDVAGAREKIDINQGFTTRCHNLAKVDIGDGGGETCVSIFRSTPMDPVVIRLMERHPLGSQAFIPLDRRPYLVVVAPPGEFQADAIRVFRAKSDQGVNYAKGVWHHFLLALETQSDFLVIDRAGPGDNLDEIVFDERQQFKIET